MTPVFSICPQRGAARRGFTLLELLVALAVMGVATTILFKLYVSATDFARTARDRTIAAAIAEEQLVRLRNYPEQFVWQLPNPPSSELFPVLNDAEEPPAGNQVDAPRTLPPEEDAYNKAQVLYDQFRWKAFGRIPDPNAPYVEVTVGVYWKQGGRDQHLAISSAVMRRAIPAAAGDAAL